MPCASNHATSTASWTSRSQPRAGVMGRGRGGARQGVDAAAASPVCEEPAQTGGATKQPRSGSLKDSLATSSFMGLAVPHWSVTSGREKS